MNLKELLEEYKGSIKFGPTYYKIYELEPAKYKEEMLSAGEQGYGSKITGRFIGNDPTGATIPSIRFIAVGSTKQVYVFSEDLLHNEVSNKLRIDIASKDGTLKQLMYGYAYYITSGKKWKFNGFSYMINKNGVRITGNTKTKWDKSEWDFLNKYIPLT